MKKSLLLGLLALSSTIFASVSNNVDVSANLIRAVEITPQTSTAQTSISTMHTGEYSFPDTVLDIVGNPGSSVTMSVPQTSTLTKAGAGAGGGTTTTVNVTFSLGTGSGKVTTDGTNATAIQELPASGNMQASLKLSGNLSSALSAGTYVGTMQIQANYN